MSAQLHAAARTRLFAILAVLGSAGVLGAFAPAANALDYSYCGRLVASYMPIDRCQADSVQAHSWSTNRNTYNGGGTLDWGCATISDDKTGPLAGTGTLYGSGCWSNTTWYYMCTSQYSNPTYWAWITQKDGSARHTLGGRATTNGCGGEGLTAAGSTGDSLVMGAINEQRRLEGTDDISTSPQVLRAANREVFVSRGSRQTCAIARIQQDTVVNGCSLNSDFARGTAGFSTVEGGIAVWGVAPANAKAATLRITTKAGQSAIETTSGAAYVVVDSVPTALEWVTG